MPITTDSPLIGDYIDRQARMAALKDANDQTELARQAYEARVKQSIPAGPEPTAPSLIARSMATLGSNLATALSGRDIYAERTSMSQMAEDAQYQQALAQHRAQQQQQNLAIRADLVQQARDQYLKDAEAARDLGNQQAQRDLQTEALKSAKELAKLHEEQDTIRNQAQINARHEDVRAQIQGDLDAAQARQSPSGDPVTDKMLYWTREYKNLMDEARARYLAATPKGKATTKGFKKFIAEEEDTQFAFSVLNQMIPKFILPQPGEDSQKMATRLKMAGFNDDAIKTAVDAHIASGAIEDTPVPAVSGVEVKAKRGTPKFGGLVGKVQSLYPRGVSRAPSYEVANAEALRRLLIGY